MPSTSVNSTYLNKRSSLCTDPLDQLRIEQLATTNLWSSRHKSDLACLLSSLVWLDLTRPDLENAYINAHINWLILLIDECVKAECGRLFADWRLYRSAWRYWRHGKPPATVLRWGGWSQCDVISRSPLRRVRIRRTRPRSRFLGLVQVPDVDHHPATISSSPQNVAYYR